MDYVAAVNVGDCIHSGYRMGEKPIELELIPQPAAEDWFVVLSDKNKHKLYESESHALFDEACRLGFASPDNKPAFPYPTKKYPHKSKWHSLGRPALLHHIPPEALKNKNFLASISPNNPCVYDADENTMTCDFSGDMQIPSTFRLTFRVDGHLGWHLRGGHAAYLRFTDYGEVEWATVPDKWALDAFDAQRQELLKNIRWWQRLYNAVEHQRLAKTSVAQQALIAKLDDEYYVSFDESPTKRGETHLFKANLMNPLKAGERACGGFMRDDENCALQVSFAYTDESGVVSSVPAPITCKDCLAALDEMLACKQ